jgi:hypothetical protein
MRILYDFSFHESTQNSTPGRDVEKTGDIARAKEHWQGDLDSDSSSEWANYIKTPLNTK